MNHAACISMLICNLAILASAAFLPFINSDLRKEHRPQLPIWTVLLAAAGFLAAFLGLLRLRLTQPGIIDALSLTAALLGGVCLTWLMETWARREYTIHEAVLFRALLVAPIAAAIAPRVFGFRPTTIALTLWLLNGFFWHTLFSDITRLTCKQPVIIRRREPPTLPYDFRKPETD